MKNSLIKPPFIPVWARGYKNSLFFIYNGGSMAPLFKPGDFLCAHNPILGDIRLGDIVIIQWEGSIDSLDYVVHRVVSVKREYLITQGDNNLSPDSQLVTNDNLIGLVTSFERKSHVYPVNGGAMGLFYARLIHARNHLWLFIKRLGWRIYGFIRLSGLVARVWRPAITQLRLMTDKGPLIKYCHGNRTIAHWWIEKRYFNVLKPFDLVIPNPEESK
jgi:signal peptidase I